MEVDVDPPARMNQTDLVALPEHGSGRSRVVTFEAVGSKNFIRLLKLGRWDENVQVAGLARVKVAEGQLGQRYPLVSDRLESLRVEKSQNQVKLAGQIERSQRSLGDESRDDIPTPLWNGALGRSLQDGGEWNHKFAFERGPNKRFPVRDLFHHLAVTFP